MKFKTSPTAVDVWIHVKKAAGRPPTSLADRIVALVQKDFGTTTGDAQAPQKTSHRRLPTAARTNKRADERKAADVLLGPQKKKAVR